MVLMTNISSTKVSTVKILSIEQYLKKIKPYLGNMIDELKIHIANFMSSKDKGD